MHHQSRCQQHWRTLLPPGRDRHPVRSPRTFLRTLIRTFPDRRRASRGHRPSRARRLVPAHLRVLLHTREDHHLVQEHLSTLLHLLLLVRLPLDQDHLSQLDSLHLRTMAHLTMDPVLALGHSDHHLPVLLVPDLDLSLLDGRDPQDHRLWADLQVQGTLTLPHQDSHLEALSLAFRLVHHLDMAPDTLFQDLFQHTA